MTKKESYNNNVIEDAILKLRTQTYKRFNRLMPIALPAEFLLFSFHYLEAAKSIRAIFDTNKSKGLYIPAQFLLRHSFELFLKGINPNNPTGYEFITSHDLLEILKNSKKGIDNSKFDLESKKQLENDIDHLAAEFMYQFPNSEKDDQIHIVDRSNEFYRYPLIKDKSIFHTANSITRNLNDRKLKEIDNDIKIMERVLKTFLEAKIIELKKLE